MKKKTILLIFFIACGSVFGTYKLYRYYIDDVHYSDEKKTSFIKMGNKIGRRCVELYKKRKEAS